MLTSIVRRKFPVTTLLRSIGYETDKDILELFGMADEVKGDKKSLQQVSLAAAWLPVFSAAGLKTSLMRIPVR
jgi:DNA-directed RNA polymerase beta subunit